MSGKVVEHRYGFRAGRAEVVAAVVGTRDEGVTGSEDLEWISGVFSAACFEASCDADVTDLGPLNPRYSRALATEYLLERKERMDQRWTSANPSA